MSSMPLASDAADVFSRVARAVLTFGGSVLLPESDPLLATEAVRTSLFGHHPPRATLAYGQPLTEAGLHVVATESDHWVENLAALGGSGAHVFLGLAGAAPQQGHPMLPLLQVAERGALTGKAAEDIDVVLSGDVAADASTLLRHL